MSAVELDLIKPDDFHHHFRDGDALPALVPLVAKRFRRAVRMFVVGWSVGRAWGSVRSLVAYPPPFVLHHPPRSPCPTSSRP